MIADRLSTRILALHVRVYALGSPPPPSRKRDQSRDGLRRLYSLSSEYCGVSQSLSSAKHCSKDYLNTDESLQHISALMRHVIEGLLDHASPEEWFLDESSATFILKLVLYALQTMTGDGVLVRPSAFQLW